MIKVIFLFKFRSDLDPAKVRDTATYADPHHLAEGMAFVLVNGEVVLDEGRFSDALPGKVLRK